MVTNCQAPSYRERATWNCKGVLADSETHKESKYAHLAVPNQAQIIGLAFDTLGGMGPHAQELINYICVLSQESPLLLSPRDFVSLLRDRISIALAQRAGALVEEGESRVLNATNMMLIARPSPPAVSTHDQSNTHNRTHTQTTRTRPLPKGLRTRWTPVRRRQTGSEDGNGNGGLRLMRGTWAE